uniref:Acidic leucine-rich nuclear phosphoprotein 32-related protein-like isoform X1 n=1 Tax=Phascolarctos cinereus TaxID=38626 RepID=A0A6P5JNQ2_PHACI|nr:acidic leucine-rich nuclear phosphoprotein 32-related protein-like isoform X1 [Phascolarctos cinereus]
MRQQDMSESSSGLNRSSRDICESNSSHYSELSETNTWTTLCRNRGTLHSYSDSGISSPLPSDSFKYLTWNNLDQHDVQGNQLRCPRVRKGPSEEDLLFRREEYNFPPKKKVLEKDKWEKWQQENWEECTNLNISFQALGDPYQADNLNRILRRLIRVRTLWLVDNSLTDLSAIRLPRCKELNVSKNCFTSFKQLPKIPETRHLSLAENQIATLSGLSSLQSTPLESLMLKRNPCEFHQNYRKQVFSSLPNLKVLDGVPKLPEDHSLPEMSLFSKMCTIF